MAKWKHHCDGWLMLSFIVYCSECDESMTVPTVERSEAERIIGGHGWWEKNDKWFCGEDCKQTSAEE